MVYYCYKKRHLVCKPYSIENLHKMAEELNIGKHWYHGGKHPHYDIPLKRKKEIMNKSVLVSSKEIYKIIHENDDWMM